ncbi:MAG: putative Peptidoglycan glycosyltransferase, partial [Patescibacteria group bacterium]|nr:putative Peptidoglycan glycosyltransferase [Patescibacteria group bacterium]
MRRKYIAIFLLFLGIFGTVLAVPFAMPLLSTKVSASDLSSKEQIMNRNNTGIILLDRNGQEFYRFYQARHLTPTPVSLIPPHVRNAIIAAEDKEFYSHPGYSLRAAAASLIANLRKGEYAYGGSTITQQLVKNSFLSTEKTYIRKYKEILLAKEMEKTYSKDEILEMYLNSVYFGEGAFGIEEAAKAYFSKSISDLTISESALLAGLLSAPSSLSPISGDKERAIERQHAVLEEMFAGGHITKEEHDTALAEKLVFKPYIEPETQYKAPHFAYMVRRELIDKYGEETVAR